MGALIDYINKNVQEDNVCYELLSLTWSSIAEITLAPLLDLLELGKEWRMNLLGAFGGSNWVWSSRPGQMSSLEQHWIFQLTETYCKISKNFDDKQTLPPKL